MPVRAIHWFRKGLRLHDNPALLAAIKEADQFWPIFILDPWFAKHGKVGLNRYVRLCWGGDAESARN